MQSISVRLRLISEDETEQHDLDVTFERAEVSVLRKYVSNCDRLSAATIFKKRFPALKTISCSSQDGLSVEVSEFNYTETCELLHLARPIFLAREPASFERAQAIFGKRSEGNALARHLKALRNDYELGDYQPYFQISVGGTPLFHNTTVMTWLNGVEYHQDEEKAVVIENLQKSLSSEVLRGVFMAQLSGRIRATMMLAELAKLVSGSSAQ